MTFLIVILIAVPLTITMVMLILIVLGKELPDNVNIILARIAIGFMLVLLWIVIFEVVKYGVIVR